MFTHAFLEERNGKVGYEETLLRAEFERRHIPVDLLLRRWAELVLTIH